MVFVICHDYVLPHGNTEKSIFRLHKAKRTAANTAKSTGFTPFTMKHAQQFNNTAIYILTAFFTHVNQLRGKFMRFSFFSQNRHTYFTGFVS